MENKITIKQIEDAVKDYRLKHPLPELTEKEKEEVKKDVIDYSWVNKLK